MSKVGAVISSIVTKGKVLYKRDPKLFKHDLPVEAAKIGTYIACPPTMAFEAFEPFLEGLIPSLRGTFKAANYDAGKYSNRFNVFNALANWSKNGYKIGKS